MPDHFALQFKPIPKVLAAVKALPNRSWDWNNKYWKVPLSHKDLVTDFAKKFGLDFDRQAEVVNTKQFIIPDLPELKQPITLKRPLFHFQEGGVAYMMEKRRVISGDDMGMGKTSQAIAALAGLHQMGEVVYPALVICPSSVKINWQREFATVSGAKALVLVDSIKNTFMEYYRAGMAQVFIVNYESLKKYFVDHIDDPGINEETGRKKPLRINHIHFKEKYKSFFKSIVADEAHRLKSLATLTTKIVKGLTTDKENILLLTGTPVINKPQDLVALLGIMNHMKTLGGYQFFMKHYCSGPREASNLQELNYNLNKHCFYRRNKTDKNIIQDLPDKMRQKVICQLSKEARKEYDHAKSNVASYLAKYRNATTHEIEKSMNAEILMQIGVLKNISARGKLKDVFDFIHDTLASGQKLVVFASLTEIIEAVQKEFPHSVRITGQDDTTQKQAAIDRFQTDPGMMLIVCNLKAAGVGVTLTAASNVAFIEQGWHSAIMDQAEDRCFRIGQKNNVMCTYFLGEDTIDEDIYDLIQKKREIANTVSGAVDEFETTTVQSLINILNK
ncbi:SWI/SNF-related matrix-associated actin-dependent regulator 1 of chromatin subfamily A [Pedobacter zeae]|nr:SWI/SNF-related matrix-associated actin-dependent regulator 1 of chromatin subfamily A [Pedobacter zeae]